MGLRAMEKEGGLSIVQRKSLEENAKTITVVTRSGVKADLMISAHFRKSAIEVSFSSDHENGSEAMERVLELARALHRVRLNSFHIGQVRRNERRAITGLQLLLLL